MTRYSFDRTSYELVCVRHSDEHRISGPLARLPADSRVTDAQHLAEALTSIVVSVREACERPRNRLDRELDALENIGRHEQQLQLLAAVDNALREPDPFLESLQSLYDPAERAGHRAGRALHALGDETLRELVTRHINAELRYVVQNHPPAVA